MKNITELEKDLKALATKRGMHIDWSCLYCARKNETFGWPETGESFMITLTEKQPKAVES